MTLLRLSREGIFPITVDADGNKVAPPTGLSRPGTIQGEGKLCGTPSLFVRLQGCNLRCRWATADGTVSVCDTAHTWAEAGGTTVEVSAVVRTIGLNIGAMRHVVITGGEPLLQPEALAELLTGLHAMGLHTTVETNGMTSAAPPTLPQLTSLSPKLSGSGATPGQRRASARGAAILVDAAQRSGEDFQLKFVVATAADEAEIKTDYAEVLQMARPSDVIVMPLGATPSILRKTTPLCLEMSLANGWRFGPRLHISLFGNREGT